jgi:hypothetical protein
VLFFWKHFPLQSEEIEFNLPLFYINVGDQNIDDIMFFNTYIMHLKL